MKKNKVFLSVFMILLLLMLVACNREIKYLEQTGTFSEKDISTTSYKYTNNNAEGFYATLNFTLNSGKVTWSIHNPKGTLIYEGYAFVKDGKTIKALTFPVNTENKDFNAELEQTTTETFDYLQFDAGNSTGEYILTINPIKAKCNYEVNWFNRLPKK